MSDPVQSNTATSVCDAKMMEAIPDQEVPTPEGESARFHMRIGFQWGWTARDVECKRLRDDLDKAIQYLREGKAKFAPHTTNSFVDDLIEKYSTGSADAT